MRKSLWIMLAVLFVAIGPRAARADTVTLNVSGSLSPMGDASCAPSPCLLGGDIVINNTTGAIISADVTMSGAMPSVGPFTQPDGPAVALSSPNFRIRIQDTVTGAAVVIVDSSPSPVPLIGFVGGPLLAGTAVTTLTGPTWVLISGDLTPAVATPEPSSAGLMLLGLGLVLLLKRNSRGHQLAT